MAEAVLVTLAVVIGVAAIAHYAARIVNAPPAALSIIAGLLARPVIPRDAFLEALLFLALAFLLFAAGVNMHPARFPRATLGAVLIVGLGATAIAGVIGAAAAAAAGWTGNAIPYAGAAVGLSSTVVVLQTLAIRGEMVDAHGRLLAGALLVQDLVAILLIAILPHVPGSFRDAGVAVAGVIALGLFALVVARVVGGSRFWRLVADAETRTLLAFALTFGFMLLASALGAPAATGAFLAGLAVARFPANVHLRPAVRAAREFFTPVFLVVLGAFFPLPAVADVPAFLLLLAAVLVVKPVIVALVSRLVGFPRRVSAHVGDLSGQGSEFTLVLITVGVVAEDLTASGFAVLGLVVAASFLVTPLRGKFTARLLERVLPEDRTAPPVPTEGHVVVLGVGRAGSTLVRALHARGTSLVVVDMDPNAFSVVPKDVPRVLGDARDPQVLHAAHAWNARAIVMMLRKDEVVEEVLEALADREGDRERVVLARVFTEEGAERLSDRGIAAILPHEVAVRALDEAVTTLVERAEAADATSE